MSQRIHFWYQISPKMLIFGENCKKSISVKKKILGQATKMKIEFKC